MQKKKELQEKEINEERQKREFEVIKIVSKFKINQKIWLYNFLPKLIS